MIRSYFLGANSRRGFASLYEGFARAPGDFLHVIKGGPGTGKSSLMRRVAAEAARRGLDAELVRCSGDPRSLDGVYVPALRQGWVDGTAPHSADPPLFGAAGDYVELGRFCRLPLSEGERRRAERLAARAKAENARAAAWIAAAASARDALRPALWTGELEETVRKRVRAVLRRGGEAASDRGPERRFLRAISREGIVTESPGGDYTRLLRLDDGLMLASPALRAAEEEARAKGLRTVLCLSPLEPGEAEGLLLPELGLALLSETLAPEGARGLRLDRLAPPQERETLSALRRGRGAQQAALEQAGAALHRAGEAHDALEALIRPRMDFEALTAFGDELIEKAFR